MPKIEFEKVIIACFKNQADINTFHTVGDFNGDGRPDIAICGRSGEMAWFENPGSRKSLPWKKHTIDFPANMECGGNAVDLTGSGLPDIINGSDWQGREIYWWENPGRGIESDWVKRVIKTTSKGQFHDTSIGDVTGDGRLSLIFTNQEDGTDIYVIPLPDDPYKTPWPDQVLAASGLFESNPGNKRYNGKQPEEGLAIGDIDGDGVNEFVVGTSWYKLVDGRWERYRFATDYITTKCLIADIDADGHNEIILAEGDPCIYGKSQGGKLGIFKPGSDIRGIWTEWVVDTGLLDAHSLQCADLFGTGRLDLFVGEIGVGDGKGGFRGRPPVLAVYRNLGNGMFEKQVIDEGTGIHEAVLVDMDGDGRPDIVGKPLHGPGKWEVHVYFNNGIANE